VSEALDQYLRVKSGQPRRRKPVKPKPEGKINRARAEILLHINGGSAVDEIQFSKPAVGWQYVCIACYNHDFYLGNRDIANRSARRSGWVESPLGWFCFCCANPGKCDENGEEK
jgi:hypothetical protein